MNSVVSIFTAHELSIMNGLYGTTLLTELTEAQWGPNLLEVAVISFFKIDYPINTKYMTNPTVVYSVKMEYG